MFDKQVQEVKDIPEYTLEDIYQFVKSVYEYVIPENKEPGEHGFNVLDYIEMEHIGAWLKAETGKAEQCHHETSIALAEGVHRCTWVCGKVYFTVLEGITTREVSAEEFYALADVPDLEEDV